MLLKKLRTFLLFVKELITSPATVGAICPSSRQLAKQMADRVPKGDGFVVELGAGTGNVTQALLDSGIKPDRLIVFDRSASFVQHLRKRFPAVSVFHANATALSEYLPKNVHIDAVVSSIPLRAMSPWESNKAIEQWRKILKPNSLVVQFTYDIRQNQEQINDYSGFMISSDHVVWMNLPPARVFTMRRQLTHEKVREPESTKQVLY